MAGRGRGRGRPIVLLSGDQVGFGKIEVLPPVLQPPPKYPLLEYKATPSTATNEIRYSLTLKRDFAEFMRESPNYVLPIVVKKDIERFSDRYEKLTNDQQEYQSRYDWTRMPLELKPSTKRNLKVKNASNKKRRRDVDVESKLQELERNENTQHSDNEEEEKEDEVMDKDDAMEEVEEEQDEEMDEGTDYVNNYFDNGEDYDDEDENLDDGGTYS